MAKRELEINIKKGKLHLPIANEKDWELDDQENYSPLELTVISVAACGARVFQSMANKSNIGAELRDVQIHYTREDSDNARPLKTIELVYSVDAGNEKEERMSKAIVSRIERYCPVMQSLDPKITVNETIEFVR